MDLKTATNYVICVKGNPTTLAVNDVHLILKIKVFPNPFSSKITIENPIENETYQLYSEIGQNVFTGKNIENQDFSSLPKGNYFLRINGQTNPSIKLIK
jgi:hypothetical protein